MEHTFEALCPTCGEPTAISIDMDDGDLQVAVDCQVCCHPLHATVKVDQGEIVHVEVGVGW